MGQIGPQVGCSHEQVRVIARGASGRPQRRAGPWLPGPGRLRLCDREEISLGLHAGEAFTLIAARLGKATSTVSREVAGNGGRGGYRAWRAHQRADRRARRPKAAKLASPRLAAQVTGWLEEWWSPQEISARLRIEFADDPMMQVSHETIYQALFVQGRGELRRELAHCLRTGWWHRFSAPIGFKIVSESGRMLAVTCAIARVPGNQPEDHPAYPADRCHGIQHFGAAHATCLAPAD